MQTESSRTASGTGALALLLVVSLSCRSLCSCLPSVVLAVSCRGRASDRAAMPGSVCARRFSASRDRRRKTEDESTKRRRPKHKQRTRRQTKRRRASRAATAKRHSQADAIISPCRFLLPSPQIPTMQAKAKPAAAATANLTTLAAAPPSWVLPIRADHCIYTKQCTKTQQADAGRSIPHAASSSHANIVIHGLARLGAVLCPRRL